MGYYLLMDSYTKTINLLHNKLLKATSKQQEDRIINLMLAEVQRYQLSKESQQLTKKENINIDLL